MPFPLVAIVPALIAWGTRAAATYGLARLFSDEPVQELKRLIYSHVVQYAAQYAGLSLDPDDPLSDASFAGAITAKTGITIRTLRDRESIVDDLSEWAASEISRRSGFHVRSITDQAVLRQDLIRVGAALLSSELGIPAGVIAEDGGLGEFDRDAVRGRVLAWAKGQLLGSVNADVRFQLNEIIQAGGIESVAAMFNSDWARQEIEKRMNAGDLALLVAERMAVEAVTDFQNVAWQMSKRSRRQEQLRVAQAKFRRRHGNRQKYVPLGMVAEIG